MCKMFRAIILILCFASITGFAQAAREKSAPTGLALEVSFLKEKAPAYIAISDSLATARWAWYGAFRRVENFQTSAEKPPVQAVKFIPFLEGDTVRVKIRVFLGQKTFEKEHELAVYSMREGEKTTVKELADFGVIPFEIAVVRVAPTVPVLPSIENKTVSLQVLGLEPIFSTLPTFKLKLANTSSKAVTAFTFETVENGRTRVASMPQNEHGEILIEPGANFAREIQIPVEYKKLADGETAKFASRQTIVISSVIFADGSFEGFAPRAGQFRAYTTGKKFQIKQIVALLERYENAADSFDWSKFAADAAKLETKISERDAANLLKQFSSFDEKEKQILREHAEAASLNTKADFISGTERNLKSLEPSQTAAYLKALKERYKMWLAQLP